MVKGRTFKDVLPRERPAERKEGSWGDGYLGNLAQAKSLWQLDASLWSSPMAVLELVRQREFKGYSVNYSTAVFTKSLTRKYQHHLVEYNVHYTAKSCKRERGCTLNVKYSAKN